MILFDLKCARDHVFEAWFPNNAAYEKQAKAGAIACPACASRKVEKAPMAPRIGKAPGEKMTAVASEHAEIRKKLVELRSRIEASCDYVGDKFAEEARRIHYGETDKRGIYGETSDDEAAALADEGIEFGRLPWVPKGN
jgi:hypothetical protein